MTMRHRTDLPEGYHRTRPNLATRRRNRRCAVREADEYIQTCGTPTRKNRNNLTVLYLQLAPTSATPKRGLPKAKVTVFFGCADQVDLQALRRLVQSIWRFLDLDDTARAQAEMDGHTPLSILWGMSFGGAWVP